jgi:general secretion pathway protein I
MPGQAPRGRPRSLKREVGFTLVEVVVAFALLALVLVTVFEIFTAGLSRAGELDHYARALAIAQSELAAAGVEEALAEGEMRGESSDRQYRWTVTTLKHNEEVDPAKPVAVVPYTLYRVQARVAWTAGNGAERDVALSTLLITQTR